MMMDSNPSVDDSTTSNPLTLQVKPEGLQGHLAAHPLSTRYQSEGGIPWVIEFHPLLEGTSQKVQVQVRDMMTVGRGKGAGAPDVDLTSFDALKHGVSRRHAVILARSKFLSLRDLNSTNGTLLNGLLLNPNQDVPLEHGDTISFGHLKVELSFSLLPPDTMFSPSQTLTKGVNFRDVGQGKRILLMEEQPQILEVYRLLFAQAGFVSIFASNMMESAAAITAEDTDAIMLDWDMRGANALEIIYLLRSRPESQSLPLVVIANSDEPRTIERALRAGADLCLTKPLRVDEMVAQMTHLLTSRGR
ncbi:MAG: FHA domain-containing protein [Phototrophicaceae bacterium]